MQRSEPARTTVVNEIYPRHAPVDLKRYAPSVNDPAVLYGLPQNVLFCESCAISNQRPNSAVEFKYTKESRKSGRIFSPGSTPGSIISCTRQMPAPTGCSRAWRWRTCSIRSRRSCSDKRAWRRNGAAVRYPFSDLRGERGGIRQPAHEHGRRQFMALSTALVPPRSISCPICRPIRRKSSARRSRFISSVITSNGILRVAITTRSSTTAFRLRPNARPAPTANITASTTASMTSTTIRFHKIWNRPLDLRCGTRDTIRRHHAGRGRGAGEAV
jgi:hypothetical protein